MAAKCMKMPSAKDCIHALITGPPGIGKTTLVCSVCQILQERHHIELHGFYTEEVRVGGAGRRGTRVGFDVVCFDGKRGPLARTEGVGHHHQYGPPSIASGRKPIFVGKYHVNLESFESIALPNLQHTETSIQQTTQKPQTSLKIAQEQELKSDEGLQFAPVDKEQSATEEVEHKTFYVVDEVGKMELFSCEFVKIVQGLFRRSKDVVVMATIPVARHKSHWLVEELRHREDCKLFEVTEKNRDELVETVSKFILQRI